MASDPNAECRKLADTPFPFQCVQAATALLLCFVLCTPFIIVAYTRTYATGTLTTFLLVLPYTALACVARKLEHPFRTGPNQLPLAQAQYALNERILAVTQTERPAALTDAAPLAPPHNMPPAAGNAHVRIPPCCSRMDALMSTLACIYSRLPTHPLRWIVAPLCTSPAIPSALTKLDTVHAGNRPEVWHVQDRPP